MRCLAVCHTELVGRLLEAVLASQAELELMVETAALARRLHDLPLPLRIADAQRIDSYVKADLTPGTVVLVEDTGRKGLRKVLEAVVGAGGTLVYVLGARPRDLKRADALKADFPDVNTLTLAELTGPPLMDELARSMTRQKVQQYQHYFRDADRVLILTHNDPDPDALASGLALRALLRRTRQTAIIGCLAGVTRPENLRMVKALNLVYEVVTPEQFHDFDKIALVDVQPQYFGGQLPRADLVIDHHPDQGTAGSLFRDVRPSYGSTCTILTEHLRAADVDISERIATAMLYAVKSDTMFFNRQANRADLEAFSYLYPRADASLIRRMEGAEITAERLEYVIRAWQSGQVREHVFCTFLGTPPREDFIPYVADFYMHLEDVEWAVVSGIVQGAFVVSVRNMGDSRHAGDFVRRWFSDIGSAGGHRAMAKAVVPLSAFADKLGTDDPTRINARVHELLIEFLHETRHHPRSAS
ncbi:MAG: hypothetical protein FJW29_05670 [Acidobacteria bacterium]|nr:hypothetical protein [Acidobacteriota bacterium]